MLFEKAIRRRQLLSSSQGHFEPDTEAYQEVPLMSLNPLEFLPNYLDEEKLWPQSIELLLKWLPEVIQEGQVRAQEIVSDQELEVCDFYAVGSSDKPEIAQAARYRAIRFLYADQAKFIQDETEQLVKGVTCGDWSIELPQDGVFYRKLFSHQVPGLIRQYRKGLGEGEWMVTAPKTGVEKKNRVPLLCYGAHIPTKSKVGEIEQIYASLSTTGQKTLVKIYKESKLASLGISPVQGGFYNGWTYEFIDLHAKGTDLPTDIRSGKILFTLKRDEGFRSYISADFKETGQGKQRLRVSFIPQELKE